MPSFIKFVVLLVSLGQLAPSFSNVDTTPIVIAIKLDGLIEQDKTGLYDKVLKDLGVAYRIAPGKRAKAETLKHNSCMFPVDKDLFETNKKLIQSDPLQIVHIHLFSTNKKLNNLDDVKNLKIGMRKGISFGGKISSFIRDQRVDYSTTLEQNIKKLEIGRVDVLIEFKEDVQIYLKNNKFQKRIQFIESPAISQFDDAVTCVDTPENRKFIEQLNPKIKEYLLKNDLGNP